MRALPVAFTERMRKQLGAEEAERLFSALEGVSPVAVRLNPAKCGEAGVWSDGEAIGWSKNGRKLKERPSFTLDTAFHAGAYYVQEAASQFIDHIISNEELQGKRVLDMGSGTGVLAIVAAKLGAESVLAVEIDDMAEESVRENIALNGVENKVESICGDASAIEGREFDVVLANINRNILLADMEAYDKTIVAGGHLVLSGFLAEDIDILVEKAVSLGYELAKRRSNDVWQSLELIKLGNK